MRLNLSLVSWTCNTSHFSRICNSYGHCYVFKKIWKRLKICCSVISGWYSKACWSNQGRKSRLSFVKRLELLGLNMETKEKWCRPKEEIVAFYVAQEAAVEKRSEVSWQIYINSGKCLVQEDLSIHFSVTRRRSGARLTKEKSLVVYGFLDRFLHNRTGKKLCLSTVDTDLSVNALKT